MKLNSELKEAVSGLVELVQKCILGSTQESQKILQKFMESAICESDLLEHLEALYSERFRAV